MKLNMCMDHKSEFLSSVYTTEKPLHKPIRDMYMEVHSSTICVSNFQATPRNPLLKKCISKMKKMHIKCNMIQQSAGIN